MSFQEQERALFDLLFDRELRRDFGQRSSDALDGYDLTELEKQDFASIRFDGLELDSKLRVDLILSQIGKVYPLTFALMSSLEDGAEMLEFLVDQQTVNTLPAERAQVYGERLKVYLESYPFEVHEEQAVFLSVLQTELGMAVTSATLKQSAVNERAENEKKPAGVLASDWQSRPLQFSEHISATVIPRTYSGLQSSLLSCEVADAWHRVRRDPLNDTVLIPMVEEQDPRVLMVKAVLKTASHCDPKVEHITLELSEGFAPLLQHINGSHSVVDLMDQLKAVGANDDILASVKTGFEQMVEQGIVFVQ